MVEVIVDHIPCTTSVSVWHGFRLGSSHDPLGKSGLAHLTEHLVGSKMLSCENTIRECRGSLQAHTGLDYTCFTWTIPSTYWDQELLCADINLSFDITAEEVDTETRVVAAERTILEREPKWRLSEEVLRCAFANHPYATTVLGRREDLEALVIGDVQSQCKRLLEVRQVLVVTGNIDEEETISMASKSLRPHMSCMEGSPPIPSANTLPFQPFSLVGGRQPYFSAVYEVANARHPDALPLLILAMMLDGAPWWRDKLSRSRRIIDPSHMGCQLPTVQINYGMYAEMGLWQFSGFSNQPYENVHALLASSIDRVAFQLDAAHILCGAKHRARAYLAYTMDQHATRATWLGKMKLILHLDYLSDLEHLIASVLIEDIRRVATVYFSEPPAAVGWLIPEDLQLS